MSTHFVLHCSCGAVIAQCRCPDPAKHVEVRPHGCPACQAAEALKRASQAQKVAVYGEC